MQPVGNNLEVVQKFNNPSLTNDSTSADLFSSVMSDSNYILQTWINRNHILPTPFRGNDDFEIVDELPSMGRPAGATAEGHMSGPALRTQPEPAINPILKKYNAVDELPSRGKPHGATTESQPGSQQQERKSSIADPAQQNRGVEIEGRKRNARATAEKRTTTAPYKYGYM